MRKKLIGFLFCCWLSLIITWTRFILCFFFFIVRKICFSFYRFLVLCANIEWNFIENNPTNNYYYSFFSFPFVWAFAYNELLFRLKSKYDQFTWPIITILYKYKESHNEIKLCAHIILLSLYSFICFEIHSYDFSFNSIFKQ